MKKLLLAVLLLGGSVSTLSPALAATCSGGANCTACKNCSGCGHCAKRGGTCSVCRPDLYRSTGYTAPPAYVPPRAYKPQPRRSAPSTAPRFPKPVQATIPAQWSGQCVGVSDGDTVKVMLHGKAQTIRLYGIDTPEKAQAYGTRAKQFTSTLAFGKPVKVFSKGMDRYGRVLAWIFVGSTCVNAQLVSNGLAWWYRQYSPNEAKLAQLEAQARSARRGLWADAAPVAPWEYRRPKRH